jgi:hypothetical protein
MDDTLPAAVTHHDDLPAVPATLQASSFKLQASLFKRSRSALRVADQPRCKYPYLEQPSQTEQLTIKPLLDFAHCAM